MKFFIVVESDDSDRCVVDAWHGACQLALSVPCNCGVHIVQDVPREFFDEKKKV